jgi:hypothetical protein
VNNLSVASRRVEFATNALVDLLSQTGGIPIIGHTKPVLALSFSGNGKLLATADETTWKIWQVELPQTPFANGSSQIGIQTMSLSGDGKFVATAAFGQAQLFWTDQSQRPPFQINQPDASLNNMGPSPTEAGFSVDSKLLLASDGLANASVWRVDRLENPKVIAKIPDGFQVRFASFTSDEKFILTLDNDGKVWKWQLDQLISKVKPTPMLLGDLNGLVTAAFLGGDGHLLIPTQLNTEGLEKTARFIDLFNWKEASPKGRKDVAATQAAAIGPEGSLVAIADGRKVQIWRARAGPTRVPNRTTLNLETWVLLYGHEGPVRAVSFSPDGKYIATSGEDLTARLWQLDQPFAIDPKEKNRDWSARLDELVQLAARTAGRNFTCKEWAEFFPDETYRLTFPDLPAPEGGVLSRRGRTDSQRRLV